ncbi:heavy-metal-associated domain-containing protein [Caenimonas sedimenti]|uniref:Heavy-metal-associated domain-containing protein n=1 Tax=Caenimonas sedimenti TaxID=2596921 RepID=A0A562ZNE1_9BURK|nr:heavy-metal-associated domain-containing protein [Caenimonas sedimenti]TWO70053.1 heavy-metal-associated domain-containing protein [Caenimonas sedimenti]
MITFHIPDMSCGNCASAIARAVASVDEHARLEVSIAQKLVSVQSAAAESELAKAIQEAGDTPAKSTASASRAAPASGGCCGGVRKAASANDAQAAPARRSCCCG